MRKYFLRFRWRLLSVCSHCWTKRLSCLAFVLRFLLWCTLWWNERRFQSEYGIPNGPICSNRNCFWVWRLIGALWWVIRRWRTKLIRGYKCRFTSHVLSGQSCTTQYTLHRTSKKTENLALIQWPTLGRLFFINKSDFKNTESTAGESGRTIVVAYLFLFQLVLSICGFSKIFDKEWP